MDLNELVEETVERLEDLLSLIEDRLPHSEIADEIREILQELNKGVGYYE